MTETSPEYGSNELDALRAENARLRDALSDAISTVTDVPLMSGGRFEFYAPHVGSTRVARWRAAIAPTQAQEQPVEYPKYQAVEAEAERLRTRVVDLERENERLRNAPRPSRADVRAAVCNHLETWERVLVENGHREAEAVRRVFLLIRKSSLLGRLIYGGESLRTEKCPTHEGVWRGIPGPAPLDCACDMTGWLPSAAREGG